MGMPSTQEIKELYQLVKQGQISKEEALQRIQKLQHGANGAPIADDKAEEEINTAGKLTAYLKNRIAAVLKIDARKIKRDVSLEDYGLDSLMIMKLTEEMENEFGPLSKTLFFEYPTLEELSGYFAKQFKHKLTDLLGSATATEEPAPTTTYSPAGTQSTDVSKPAASCELVIIGVSGRYPQAATLLQFWENLKAGKNCLTEIPKERWDHAAFYNPEKNINGSTYCRHGGFIDEVDAFDPLFFRITPREAKFMDPQERIFLECAYHTLEDAGYTAKSLSSGSGPASVGVFVGVMYEEYQLYAAQEAMNGNMYSLPGSPASIPNRVSYYFNFDGPSMAIDTMCSSSLTAIHQACLSIQNGDCEMAIAGGVNVSIHPNKYLLLSQANFLSETGRCAAFGEGGDGYIPGEGVGAILIKEKNKAIADGDHIYAVIKASSLNHGGKAKNYTVPNPTAQAKVITKALEKANIDPRTISYVEAHGTGTSLGDPIEITGLTKAFSGTGREKKSCAIGSVKSNIGHCESAAGIAGLTKILLQMKYKTLVPSIHTETLNENIDFENSLFKVQRELQHWEIPQLDLDGKGLKSYPRLAGISSFGAGGSNVHLILEEYIEKNTVPVTTATQPVILLSAVNEVQLRKQTANLLNFLHTGEITNNDITSIAYVLQTGRTHQAHRIGFIVPDILRLKQALQQYLDNLEPVCFYNKGRVIEAEEELNGLFHSAREKELHIQALVKERNMEALLNLWIKGVTIDWTLLYKNGLPQKISLPGYVYNKQRYWKPKPDFNFGRSNGHTNATKSYFLLQENATPGVLDFKAEFSGNENFLQHHLINGNKILPGVAYLEMVREAMWWSVRMSAEHFSIQHLKWIKPFIFSPANNTLHLRLTPWQDNRLRFEFYTGEQVVLCNGEVQTLSINLPVFPSLVQLSEAITQQVMNREELYAMFGKAGFDYGMAHQCVQRILVQDEKVLALLELPAVLKTGNRDAWWLPSILDAALQATVGSRLGKKSNEPEKLSLPYSIDTVQALAAMPETCWVYIEPATSNETDIHKQNIYLYNEEGYPVFFMKGFAVRSVGRMKTTGVPVYANAESLLLIPSLEKLNMDEMAGSAVNSNRIILYDQVLRDTINGLQLLPGISCKPLLSTAESGPEKYIDYSTQLFEEIRKQLLKQDVQDSLIQVLVSKGAALDGMAAMLKTAKMEHPGFKGQVLVLDESADAEQAIETGSRHATIPLLHFNSRVVYREIYTQAKPATVEPAGLFRKGGVYLITGGAGGLGAIFAGLIASQTPGSTIILTGRSAENEAIRRLIHSLQEKGAQAIYKKLDVTETAQVKQLINELQAAYSKINGIIHSAGILQDNYIIRKNKNEFKQVILPKVLGAYNLDAATRKIDLDWLVLFSSVSGAFGNAGQADYATGNAYMDQFSRLRNQLVEKGERKGKTISLNWPLWQNGGMKVSAELEKMIAQRTGLYPLPTTVGIEQFFQALKTESTQVITLYGDVEKMKAVLGLTTAPAPVVSTSRTSQITHQRTNNNEMIRQKGLRFLQSLLMSFLELPGLADADTNFESFGMDSIHLTHLTKRLEQEFGSLPKTIFFEYTNIRSLNEHLAAHYTQRFRELLNISEEVAVVNNPVPVNTILPANNHNQSIPAICPVQHEQLAGYKNNKTEQIAIIALAGKYPGAQDVTAFWENLKLGRDAITGIPANRWNDPAQMGGFIDNVDQFDPLFFQISPKEAEVMDPQARLFLENAWCLFENGGYPAQRIKQLAKGNIGVFVGVMSNQYAFIQSADEMVNAVRTTAAFHTIANRVSHFFDLNGPSFTIDSACSSGLTAVHLACKSLFDDECKMAVAGGVNLSILPEKFKGLRGMGMIGSDANSRSFGNGEGYLPSEGVGAVLLKKLSDAEKDGDQILAVIKSTSVNHSGRSTGYAVPNPGQQAALMEKNFERAGIDPESIGYAELAVNGSAMGDAIELSGLTKVFRNYSNGNKFCAIGSVKSNLGHGEAVSGIAQLTKVVLQLHHKQLVPNVAAPEQNPDIQLDNTPFYIQEELQHWNSSKLRRATVNSFGAGGSYSHAILEEYVPETTVTQATGTREWVFPLSARTWDDLKEMANRLLQFIATAPVAPDLASIARTLQLGRTTMKWRLAFVATSIDELIQLLGPFINRKAASDFTPGNIFFNNGERENLGFRELLSGPEGRLYRQSLIAERKLDKIALLYTWVGFDEWTELYDYSGIPFATLPNYPFNYGSYWIGHTQSEQATITPVATMETGSVRSMITSFIEKELRLRNGEYTDNDHFMELGLGSLAGRRLIQHIAVHTGVELSSRDLVQNGSIRQLVAFIEEQGVTKNIEETITEKNITKVERSALTEGQKGLWMLQQTNPDFSSYNVPVALRLPNAPGEAIIRSACEYLLYEHPILKTVVQEAEGVPFMSFAGAQEMDFKHIQLPEGDDVITTLKLLSKKPFRMNENLIRFCLVSKGEKDYYLMMVVHHIIFDGFSSAVLAKTFVEGFAKGVKGQALEMKGDRPIPFLEYVEWEKHMLDSAKGQKMKEYWTNYLSGCLPILEMPVDRPRFLALQRKGRVHEFKLDDALAQLARTFSKKHKVSLTALFLGVYKILLHRYSGEKDIIVGMPAMGRHAQQFKNAIGYFVNMIPVRSKLAGDKKVDMLLKELQLSLADCIDNAAYPFSSIVKALNIQRTNNSPVFQVAFAYQNFLEGSAREQLKLGKDIVIESVDGVQQEGEYELLLEVYEHGESFRLLFNYDEQLYEDDTIHRLFAQYNELLKDIIARPVSDILDLKLLPVNEFDLVIAKWNDTITPYDQDQLMHHGFEVRAKENPDAIALICDGKEMTYGELEVCANQLANYLVNKHGIGPGHFVAIGMHRSYDMIVGVLAILKSGGAYVPLDYENPGDRLKYICESAGATLVLMHGNLWNKFESIPLPKLIIDDCREEIAKQSITRPAKQVKASDLAYIIYTSGSTGLPKGVKIAHYSVINLFEWIEKEFNVGKHDRVLFVSSLCFDLSVYDIFGLLNAGGSIRIVKEKELKDPETLAGILINEPVTFWDSAPAALKQLVPFFQQTTARKQPTSLRLVFLSGDWIPLTLPKDVWENFPGAQVISLGGATEATVWSNYYRVKNINPYWLSIPYGKPIQNAFYYVLDSRLQPVPIGVPGNLYIGGDCVAQGYTDEMITKERFIANPFRDNKNEKLYFTGDRARFRSDGNIEFLGRVDFQVKLRGYRIELGEIESVISSHPDVIETVALVREDEPGNQLLVVYLLLEKATELDIAALKELAANKLPAYMVPSAYVALEQFPVTVNGKLDRNALPMPGYENYKTNGFEEPATEKEKALAAIWKEVLHLDKVGRQDNLFEIGGDSLILMQIIAKAANIGLNISARKVFENPTLSALALVASDKPDIIADQDKILGDVPLTPVQSWFFAEKLGTAAAWNQKLMINVPKDANKQLLEAAFHQVMEHHDMLRASYVLQKDGSAKQTIGQHAKVSINNFELASGSPVEQLRQAEEMAAEVEQQLNITEGRLVALCHVKRKGEAFDWLLISIHHLVVDAVSWQIILEDLRNCYHALVADQLVKLPLKTTSFQYWSERLYQWGRAGEVNEEAAYWMAQFNENNPLHVVPAYDKAHNVEDKVKTASLSINNQLTGTLFDKVIPQYEAKADDVLLTALTMALAGYQQTENGNWLVAIETHGREPLFEDVDLSRTVGWFTSITPVVLKYDGKDIPAMINRVKNDRNNRLYNGLHYGVLRYIQQNKQLAGLAKDARIDISFNYLGRVQSNKRMAEFEPVPGSFGISRDAKTHRPFAIEIDLVRVDEVLAVSVRYNEDVIATEQIKALLVCLEKALMEIAVFGGPTKGGPATITTQVISNQPDHQAVVLPDTPTTTVPLTGLQVAYKIGERSFFNLDNIVAHEYFEVEYTELDINRYTRAWHQLIAHHEVLRGMVTNDEQMTILENVPAFKPEVISWLHLSQEEKDRELALCRERLRTTGPTTDRWPLFHVTIYQYDPKMVIVHFNIAIILIDGMSLRLLLEQLIQLYNNPALELEKQVFNLADYHEKAKEIRNSKEYILAKLYWKKRIPYLPNPPELPLVKKMENFGNTDLLISNKLLSKEYWTAIRSFCNRFAITPSAVLLATFARVLSSWGNSSHFIFSILHANRYPVHPAVNTVLGNFSATSLFEADFNTGEPFIQLARRFQDRLQHDLEHYYYSGVEVITERNMQLKQFYNGIPIALSDTTMFGDSEEGYDFGKVNISGAQTPHVYLDCILHNQEGGINLRWAYQQGIFPPNLIQDMQESNINLLQQLAEDEKSWHQPLRLSLPASHLQIRQQANDTAEEVSNELMHTLFIKKAIANPGKLALQSSKVNMTYHELHQFSNRVASAIWDAGLKPNELVGVVMHKGWEQVPAVLATLFAGGAYMPVDAAYPKDRINSLLETGNVKIVLTQRDVYAKQEWPEHIKVMVIEESAFIYEPAETPAPIQNKEDLAYVIFTSGSTGVPKGVMIDHAGAVNTLLDINQRFNVNENDKVLAISALNFDLSVYDIFGTLAAGGTIIMPDEGDQRDPGKLAEWVKNGAVTIWNSVPAFVQIFTEYLAPESLEKVKSLRLFMMSGDWIPVDLPGKMQHYFPQAGIYSLGGATEASIWSIIYPIETVSPEWRSIPYGKAMVNQTFEVLDEALLPVPQWATGELYIGGIGVAKGYWRDEKRTGDSFIIHPKDGRRLYRTGDLGRFLPDGNIEFLGRADNQIKIQGFRVELGEIETVLKLHDLVKDCLVADKEVLPGEKQLVAYVIPNETSRLYPSGLTDEAGNELRKFLRDTLPDYMVPKYFIRITEIPVTANGKVNKKALPLPALKSVTPNLMLPRNEMERRIAAIWKGILNVESFSMVDSFFDLGGHSISAVRLISTINRQFNKEFPVSVLNEYNTVEALSSLIDNEADISFSSLVELNRNGAREPFFCIHPISGHVMSYQDLAKHVTDRPFIGIQSPGIVGKDSELDSVEKMAAYYLTLIRQRQPVGPYFIGGWSFGGIVAYEIARRLEEVGEQVLCVVLIDSFLPQMENSYSDEESLFHTFISDLQGRFPQLVVNADDFTRGTLEEKQNRLLTILKGYAILPEETDNRQMEILYQVYRYNTIAMHNYQVQPIRSAVHLIKALQVNMEAFRNHPLASNPALGWEQYCDVTVGEMDGDHYSLFNSMNAPHLAVQINKSLTPAKMEETN